MDLSVLPKDIEKIIFNYKYEMEHFEKFKHVLNDIEKNISIKYLVPFFDFDSGYLCKMVHYNDKPFQKFCSVICNCCGRQIHKTMDEYDSESDDDIDDIKDELNFIYNQIITDSDNNECVEIKDYSTQEYDKVCEHLEETLYEDLDVLNNMDQEEILEILFELGEEDLGDLIFEEHTDIDE